MVRLRELPYRETRIKPLNYFLFRTGDRQMRPAIYVPKLHRHMLGQTCRACQGMSRAPIHLSRSVPKDWSPSSYILSCIMIMHDRGGSCSGSVAVLILSLHWPDTEECEVPCLRGLVYFVGRMEPCCRAV